MSMLTRMAQLAIDRTSNIRKVVTEELHNWRLTLDRITEAERLAGIDSNLSEAGYNRLQTVEASIANASYIAATYMLEDIRKLSKQDQVSARQRLHDTIREREQYVRSKLDAISAENTMFRNAISNLDRKANQLKWPGIATFIMLAVIGGIPCLIASCILMNKPMILLVLVQLCWILPVGTFIYWFVLRVAIQRRCLSARIELQNRHQAELATIDEEIAEATALFKQATNALRLLQRVN